LAAWVRSNDARVPSAALIAAGPTFFMDPELKADHAEQDRQKATAIAASLRGMHFTALAPGKNDWAAGDPALRQLAEASGAAVVVANAGAGAAASGPEKAYVVRDFGGTKVGFVGALSPASAPAVFPVEAPLDGVKRAALALTNEGVKIKILLAATGRGEAKRLAEAVPDLTAVLVGSAFASGESNSEPPAPERVGSVVIAESGNHLTRVATLDFFVRDGSYDFADGSGLEEGQKRQELARRIDDLRVRIAAWERDGNIAKADLEARQKDLARLEAERSALQSRPAPKAGSFFRYAATDVREKMGRDPEVAATMAGDYKLVNDHNRVALAGRMPQKPTAGQPSYVGVEVCTTCHQEARAVWNKTGHARAYATLSTQFKEFNLDCVSCHVTGYDRPGGSTVTHVDKLKDVQCEVCHGPGSEHVAKPGTVRAPFVAQPSAELCRACHLPPHVERFDAVAKMNEVLGPGHGRPLQ
jgi:hypothetical protein